MSTSNSSLAALSEALAEAVDRAARSVVAVHARPRLPSTGVHWRDGLVVTTDATVRRTDGITLSLPGGRTVEATLAGRDPATDLAALRMAPGQLPVPEFMSAPARPGQLVLALGRLDDSGPRSSFGAVSSVGGSWRTWKGGELDSRLQSDLALYPGLGGGPLIDASARVLGINSGGLSRSLTTTIPCRTVDRVLDSLLAKGYVARGYLGAALQAVRFSESAGQRLGLSHRGGLVVLDVDPDGPAARGGLLLGDVVIAADDRPLEGSEDLLRRLGPESVGTKIHLDLVRGGARNSMDIMVGERPQRPS
ncbi:MAG TPA: S1C family serine protease [Gemmatimonadales bacterium]|nr:S1C family serine protease [Gemmatimonadales bacterium]